MLINFDLETQRFHEQEFFKTCQLTCEVKDGKELSGQCRDPECSLRFILRSERRHNIQLHFSGTILHSGNNQCCGSGMLAQDPGSVFFHPGSKAKKITGSQVRFRIKEFKYFNPKNCL